MTGSPAYELNNISVVKGNLNGARIDCDKANRIVAQPKSYLWLNWALKKSFATLSVTPSQRSNGKGSLLPVEAF